MKNALCFDMGGSKIVCGVVREDGAVLWKLHEKWAPKSAEEVLGTMHRMGDAAIAALPGEEIGIIGANIPGIADPVTGTWLEASFSGLSNIPVAADLSAYFGLPCWADNDGQTCALAEKVFGAAKDCDHFLYLTVSNGVGGAVYSNGLITGCGNHAGEFGHCVVVPGGRQCNCGQKGCLERYAAGPGIQRTWEEMTGETKSAEELAALARSGNAEAQKVWELEGQYLGRIIAVAANLMNPEKVIIGGGISLAFGLFYPSLKATVDAQCYADPNHPLELLATPLAYDGGLLAAAALAFTEARK
ncbi:MAG: ROK family protein [Clostridia bacterium]|nr:ROK family protein [Clostridia bacterium]